MKEAILNVGTLRYADYGSGQPVVLLHGALSNGNTWRKLIPMLAQHCRCIVPDLPLGGHSVALHAAADLSPDGIAALLKQLLDSLQLSEAVIVANDTGGAYAQVFTAAYPERVSRLVLCNTDALDVFPPKAFALLQAGIAIPGFTALIAQLFRIKPLLRTSLVLGLLSHTLTKEEIYDLYIQSFIQNRGVRADFAKVVQGWSPRHTLQAADTLRSFRKPVLLIWGSDDQKLFPLELARRLQAVFPNAQLETVAQALTYVQEDQPEEFARRLLHFLSRN
jgi:pimeloyl-ACP methyl ester carboxylesterase